MFLVKQTQKKTIQAQLSIFEEQIVFKTTQKNMIKNQFNTIFFKFILVFEVHSSFHGHVYNPEKMPYS